MERTMSQADIVRQINREKGGTNSLLAPIVFTSIIDIEKPENKELLCRYFESHTNLIWIDWVNTKSHKGIYLSVDYVSNLFEKELIEKMADSYCSFLETFTGNNERWKDMISIELPEEDRRIIDTLNYNDGEHEYRSYAGAMKKSLKK